MEKLLSIFSACLLSACVETVSENVNVHSDSSELFGAYVSGCYYSEGLDSFVVENVEYTNSTYTNNINQYNTADCSGAIEDTLTTFGMIIYENEVMTTDGLTARKAVFDNSTGGQAPQFEWMMSVIYRKDETTLYFGAYNAGEVPTINYALTYFKQ